MNRRISTSYVLAPGRRAESSLTSGPIITLRATKEFVIESSLFLAALFSILITLGILFVLFGESLGFFTKINLLDFFTDTMWAPTFDPPRYGILPLIAGTLVTTAVALAVAMPVGTIVSIYLSEFAPALMREIIKPALELLSAVPTVVYGYFALLFVTPLLQRLLAMVGVELAGFNMLSAGIVMGIMIIPYVSSLSEDAMRAVPMLLREGAYAVGANRINTAVNVVFPAALSGIGSSYVLAISRAVGETMIVAVAAGQQPNLTLNPLNPAATITAFIVQVAQGDLPHGTIPYQSIFAAGIMLFFMTITFNILGFWLRKRFRQVY